MKTVETASVAGASAQPGLAEAWRRALIFWAGFALAVSLAMAPTLVGMVKVWWNSATFNHGLLIPFIIAWLVWDRRQLVAQIRPGLFPPGLALMAGALLLWLLGRVGDVQVVAQFGWVFLIQASVLTLLGVAVTRALIFPLGYMLFLVPFGEFLIPPLQHFTAQFIVVGLQTLDIPVFLEDIFLSTPSGDFKVAEACAGVRFLIATLALGVLFANIAFHSWTRRMIVVALSVIVPIIANGLRAFGIVYIAYLTDNEYAAGVDHIVYGWGFFAFVTIVLLVIGMSFSDKKPGDAAFDITKIKTAAQPPYQSRRLVSLTAAALAISLAVPAYAAYVANRGADRTIAALPTIEPGQGWRHAGTAPADDWHPHYAGADTERLDQYTGTDGTVVTVYAALYGHQTRRRELIAYGNTAVAPDDSWSWLQSRMTRADIGGVETPVRVTRARGPYGVIREIWQVYWVGGALTADDRWAKAHGTFAKLRGGELAAGTLILSQVRSGAAIGREETLSGFAARLPAVEAYFNAALNGGTAVKP